MMLLLLLDRRMCSMRRRDASIKLSSCLQERMPAAAEATQTWGDEPDDSHAPGTGASEDSDEELLTSFMVGPCANTVMTIAIRKEFRIDCGIGQTVDFTTCTYNTQIAQAWSVSDNHCIRGGYQGREHACSRLL